MSEVEEFYYKIQKGQTGNLLWLELDPNTQGTFIQAINIILHIVNLKKATNDK